MTQKQESVLLKGLEVEPMARWQNIAELYAGLYGKAIQGGSTETLTEEAEMRTEILIDEDEPGDGERSHSAIPLAAPAKEREEKVPRALASKEAVAA